MPSQLGEDRSDPSHRKLLEISPMGLALCRMDGTFLDANPAFAAIIGHTVETTLTLNYWAVLHTECTAQDKKDPEHQLQHKCTDHCAAAYQHKDGHLVPVRVSQWTVEIEGESGLWLTAEKIGNEGVQNSILLSASLSQPSNFNLENLLAQQTTQLAKTQEQLQQTIAELEQTQAKLRHHSQIIDQIREAVICTNMDGLITSWNQASQRLYGYQESEVLGKHISLIYPPEQHQILLKKVIGVLQKKGEYQTEVITRRKSGEIFYSHLVLSLLQDSMGEVIGMIGYLTDISDRKALEQELAVRQARFDAFFKDAPAGLCILDDELRFVQINKMLAEMNDASPADHIGKTVQQIIPDIAPIVEPLYQQILRTKEPVLNVELSAEKVRQPGVMAHIVASYFPLLDAGGDAIGIGAVVIEITDRKQAEEALRQSEQLYRTMARNFPNGAVMLFDTELRYTLVEGKELAAVGLSKELMEGKTIWEIFSPEFCAAVEPNYRAALGGETVVTEFSYSDRTYLAYTLPVRNERQEITGGLLMTQNITDSQLAEEALRQSEEKYRCIVETADEGIWMIDAESKTTFVNQKMADMLGCTTDEMMQQPLFNFMDEEGIAISQANLDRRRQGIREQHDFKFCRRDGSDLWAIVSSNPMVDKQGNYIGALAMIADITDRKKAEAALQQSEAKFRSLYELTSLAVLMLDENGIRDVNNATLELFGGTGKEQFVGKNPGQFSPPFQPNGRDSLSMANEMMAIAFERGRNRFDWLHQRLDGTDFPAEVVLTIIQVGNETMIQAVVQDLSDRKFAEEVLLRSEQTLRQQARREQLLNQIASQIRNSLELETILETSVAEIRHLMQLDWCIFAWYRSHDNSAVWEVTCEAKNPALLSFLGACFVDENSSIIAQHMGQMKTLQINNISSLPNIEIGEIHQTFGVVSMLVLPIQTTSGDIGAIGCYQAGEMRNWNDSEVELMQGVAAQIAIAIDHAELYTQTRTAAKLAQAQAVQLEETLHQLQRTQSQLIQSEKMSSLGQLVAGVAHEINNPVNFIYGNLTYASEYTQSLLKLIKIYQQEYPEPTAAIVDEIETIELDYIIEDFPKIISSMKLGADRIRDIVLSLRTFSRLDEAEMKKVDIHEGIESTLMILQNRIKNKPERLPINVIKQYGDLPKVECYPGQLNQVFMNLLSNAIDAIEMEVEKSAAEARNRANTAKNLEITIRTEVTENNCVAIRIRDSGPGISEDVKKHLFDPFFTTKPVGKGTGLGLAISMSIIAEKHGGELFCNSVLGEGCEFAIEIPLRQKRD
ncbi:MAG: PAS domain S-box protein [Oscillatoriales cyanobacterium]|nr:MAG: PAS domain S-box protein [Oscillatoriales cyanobacterium]TAF01775.1 MAG: PAS domain S-box protein [Oscillatoriales cyanobacterium]TAF47138.1 MAG: PAS domain S-box protein [Oscillatoriales cyanobacterium]TAF62549.1 MAG: PAS domain S-box protein [Oscillatoriales cyanobacterium]